MKSSIAAFCAIFVCLNGFCQPVLNEDQNKKPVNIENKEIFIDSSGTYIKDEEKAEYIIEIGLAAKLELLKEEFGDFYAPYIIANKIVAGMTKNMVIESWGEPSDVNIISLSQGFHEQWYYPGAYVVFEDDVVSGYSGQKKY